MAKKEEKKVQPTTEELSRELRGYIAQIEALRAEIAVIDENIASYRTAIKTINNLRDLGKGKNILIPIGAGAQIEAKIEDPERVVVNIGSGISAELKAEEALTQIAKEIASLQALRRTLEEAIAEAYAKTEELLQKTREIGKEEGKSSK
ncbi:prefoldin alpha subunit [Persephonella hydrogeniphila]|uniref:Putative prefoldin subunit alpha n=1 Tax=Persephonella hydrogeniphila TaxID=198703 RepID=A0A285N1C2_9AQUI|nr:prefoldin subunit alpha [Persephonella hydrogeniphila]SNZ03252.1 prefoldin alpha subunit [Persephonella hydrogeniphila]